MSFASHLYDKDRSRQVVRDGKAETSAENEKEVKSVADLGIVAQKDELDDEEEEDQEA